MASSRFDILQVFDADLMISYTGRLNGFIGSHRYQQLERGGERMNALFEQAHEITGSPVGALSLLGNVALETAYGGEYPFHTGIETYGLLAGDDKASHFFAHAYLSYVEENLADPFDVVPYMVRAIGYAWEGLGELKKLIAARGAGFDWDDIWANRLGEEFGSRIANGDEDALPTDIDATDFCPYDHEPDEPDFPNLPQSLPWKLPTCELPDDDGGSTKRGAHFSADGDPMRSGDVFLDPTHHGDTGDDFLTHSEGEDTLPDTQPDADSDDFDDGPDFVPDGFPA